jgi:hypothetical protein
MLSFKDRVIAAVVRLLSAFSMSGPAVQPIPVRIHVSIQRGRR